jgi:hypothetical protein
MMTNKALNMKQLAIEFLQAILFVAIAFAPLWVWLY